jgi:uncharacterized protein involved in exopolysaccharide biosynthesis
MTKTIEKPVYSAASIVNAGSENDSESRNLPPSLLASALRTPLRRWPLSLAGIAVCGVIAVCAGLALSQKSWKAEGVLVYTQIPLPESRKGSYSPQKLETLIAIIKSNSDLETLRQEFDLPMTVEVLSKKLKVEQEPRSEKVSVSLEWGDRQTGSDIVNRLMELHIRHVGNIQKGKTSEMMTTLQAQLKEYQSERDAARTELVNFLSKKDIVDIRKDRDRLDKDVAESEKELTEARDKAAAFPQQFREIEEQILKLGNDLQAKSLADLAKVAEEDRDYRKRRKDLEENSRDEERRRKEADKEFRDADHEARTVEPLVNSGAISRSEAEKLRAKADLLRLKVLNSDTKIKEMAEDLNQLPR